MCTPYMFRYFWISTSGTKSYYHTVWLKNYCFNIELYLVILSTLFNLIILKVISAMSFLNRCISCVDFFHSYHYSSLLFWSLKSEKGYPYAFEKILIVHLDCLTGTLPSNWNSGNSGYSFFFSQSHDYKMPLE